MARLKRTSQSILDFYWGEGIAYQVPALAFYVLVSLAPLALGVVALASLAFGDLITPERVAEELSNSYPVGVRDQVVELTRTVNEQSFWLLSLSIGVMIWTSSAAIGVIERMIRSIAGAGPYPKIIWGRIRLLGLGALFATLVCCSILIGATVGSDVGRVGLFVGSVLFSAVILAVIYKLAPAIELRLSSCLLGALPAALVLQITPLAVSQYVKAGGVTLSASGIFVSLGVLLTSCFILSQGILIGAGLAARRG